LAACIGVRQSVVFTACLVDRPTAASGNARLAMASILASGLAARQCQLRQL
jgi:hypothetical protein